MPGHIGSENAPDHAFAHLLELRIRECTEDVAVVIFKNTERDTTVVVLQRGYVIVPITEICLKGFFPDKEQIFIYLRANSVLALIWYMLLYPGWSKSWQMLEVIRINVSKSPIFIGRST